MLKLGDELQRNIAYQVDLSPRACVDVDEITGWITANSADAAEKWESAFWLKLESLNLFPLGGSFAPENEHSTHEIRQIFHGVYRIIYTVSDEARSVRVLTVRHGARRFISF